MDVLIANVDEIETPIDELEIRQICDVTMRLEGIDRTGEVSVSIVDDETMRGLNREWRGIDRVTDVLSFQCDDALDAEDSDGPFELGDVILAPAQIALQAPEFGNDPADEFRLMLVHGLLHLIGYDHIVDDEAIVMEDHELEILREVARLRGADPAAVRLGPTTRHVDD